MRGPILIPLVVAGVIACKVLGAFAILIAFITALPVIAGLAIAGGTLFILVMAVVFIVKFIVWCARGFRSAEPRVLTAQPVVPPAGQRPSYRGDYRTVYGYPRRPSLFWNVFVIVGGIVLLSVVIHSARHRVRSMTWAEFSRQAHRMARDARETDDDRAEAKADWAEAKRDWPEGARKLEDIGKLVQEKVSKEMRDVEQTVAQKLKLHSWHGKTPVPPMPPAPPALPGNERPEALAEGAIDESKVLKSWDIRNAQGPTRKEAIQKGLGEAQKELIEFLQDQSPSITWVPTPGYIREHLVKDITDNPYDTGMGKSPAVDMRLEVRANQLTEMRKIDRQVQVSGRLESIGRLLTIVVAALAAVSGYIRLDLWSNRSYTNLLRLGLTAVLALVSVGVWYLPL